MYLVKSSQARKMCLQHPENLTSGVTARAQGLTINVDPLPKIVDKVLKAAASLPDDSARYDRLKEVGAPRCLVHFQLARQLCSMSCVPYTCSMYKHTCTCMHMQAHPPNTHARAYTHMHTLSRTHACAHYARMHMQ